jgi:hypothetical protein
LFLTAILPVILQFPRFCECLEAAVVGFFDVFREAAAGQLFRGQMILQTLAADAFVIAAGVRTGAETHIFSLFAFHNENQKLMKSSRT